ncbi:glycosyltransferase [Microlunatus antarcticus]|uniref:Glycosyltransferase involved in cell wall biosynthesis n=1 Tax=Microlunatus antarcticus TaxID=53388 RepID=A0A7W5JXG5_9ACTN|nr:glycosyltransferase [Microlunatus antarcticus]MBB3327527.1 glycosyltransferase involved in cell wall biosynthesis [Microlunatus antarcticus]
MKIVLGADQYPEYINGAATFTARLAAGLADAGHTVDLLWPSADGGHDTYLDRGVRVHRLSSVTLPGRPRMQVCLPPTTRRRVENVLHVARPDVVHVQSHLGLGRTLVRAARRDGVPVLATNHFMPENLLHHVPVVRRFPRTAGRLAWRDLERVYDDADLISVPTRRAADLLAASTTLRPAEVVSCGIDLDRFAVSRTLEATSRPSLLFVGRLEQEKHVDELLTAFAHLPRSLGARLEVVGMGSLRSSLEALTRSLGIEDSVRFLGAVDDDELPAAYGRADVFVMPGTAELQSIATLEAMATGLPVVAADAMALPHLVQDGVNGRLYAPGDARALAVALAQLLVDPVLRARLGRGSRTRAQAHSLSATLEEFVGHYSRLVGSRSAGRLPGRSLALAS